MMSNVSYDVLDHVTEDDRIIKIRITMRPERVEDETFEEYKMRRRLINEEVKTYKKGKLVYDPFPYGTHKELSKELIFKVPGVPYVKTVKNGEH